MYGHYGIEHFREKIVKKFGDGTKCQVCERDFVVPYKTIAHYANDHGEVESLLDPKYRIPRSPLSGNTEPETVQPAAPQPPSQPAAREPPRQRTRRPR